MSLDDCPYGDGAFPALDPTREGLQEVDPHSIILDDGIQTRAAINDRSLTRYREAMIGGADFPPVLVYVVDGEPTLVDGFHRVMASCDTVEETGRPLTVDVRFGTQQEANHAALTANMRHGAQLTRADDERRFLIASNDPSLRRLSVRRLAEFLGMDRNRVQRLRQQHAWTRPEPGEGGERAKGNGLPEPFSNLTVLTIPFGKPSAPVPLSDAAVEFLGALVKASDHCREKGLKDPGRFLAQALTGIVEGLPVTGKELDDAAREVMRASAWFYKSRQRNALLTAPEVAEKAERDRAITGGIVTDDY